MWENKKNKKSIESILHNIEDHFHKIQKAIEADDEWLVVYYIKEIENHFFLRIIKLSRTTKLSDSQSNQFLSFQKKLDEIKSISLN